MKERVCAEQDNRFARTTNPITKTSRVKQVYVTGSINPSRALLTVVILSVNLGG